MLLMKQMHLLLFIARINCYATSVYFGIDYSVNIRWRFRFLFCSCSCIFHNFQFLLYVNTWTYICVCIDGCICMCACIFCIIIWCSIIEYVLNICFYISQVFSMYCMLFLQFYLSVYVLH